MGASYMMITAARVDNITNPHQTKAKKVLCLCSAGMLRSPTIANTLHKEYGYNTRAAGVDAYHALIPVDEVLLTWADEIVCAEPSVHRKLVELYPSIPLRIVVLNLPDIFEWNSTDLIRLITKQYEDSVTMERAFA